VDGGRRGPPGLERSVSMRFRIKVLLLTIAMYLAMM
jgi:hypothetical protein